MERERDNRPACVFVIAWGALIVLLDRIWPADPFYFWLAMVMIALGLLGFTPWGRERL